MTLRDQINDAYLWVFVSSHWPECVQEREGICTCRKSQVECILNQLREIEDGHVVIITEEEFLLQHSLECRLKDELLTCNVHAVLKDSLQGEFEPGRYRVSSDGLTMHLDRLPDHG